MNREHLSDSTIQEFLDKQAALPISARRHLRDCRECQETLDAYRELHATFGTIEAPHLPSTFADRVMTRVVTLQPAGQLRRAVVPLWLWTGASVVAAVAISALVMGPTACQNLLAQFHELWSSSLSGLQTGTSKYLADLNLKPVTAVMSILTLGGIVLMDRLLARVRRSRRLMSLMV
jgi:hypothetical protein